MRYGLAMAALLLALGGGWSCAMAQDDDLSTYTPPDLPDPVANNGVHFDKSVPTADSAVPSMAVGTISPSNAGCSALNPCATPSPALSNGAPLISKDQQQLAQKTSKKRKS